MTSRSLHGVADQSASLDDYARVRRAIRFLTENWRSHPDLDQLAEQMELSPTQAQKLFNRWAGLTPKQFVQAITLDHARELLAGHETVLDTAYDVGLSGPGRLHDLFVTHEAMTPGEFRNRGAGVEIAYAFHPGPFGLALVMATPRGLCGLAFCDSEDARAETLADMTQRWPAAIFVEDASRTTPLAARIFDSRAWSPDTPLRVVMIGTDFEVRVWETLLKIPFRAGNDLRRHRPSSGQAECRARRRRGGGPQPGLLRGALSPRARQVGRTHGLSLGTDAQARDPRLGKQARLKRPA